MMKNQHLQKYNKKAGFTLIEVIASSFIIAFVLAIAVSSQYSTARSRERICKLTDLAGEVRYASNLIRRDLSNIYRGTIRDDKIIECILTESDSVPDSILKFKIISNQQIRNGYPESDLCEVEYFLDKTQDTPKLMRRIQPNYYADTEMGGVMSVIAENITNFNIRIKPDNTSEFITTWPLQEGQSSLPLYMEVFIKARDPELSKERESIITIDFPRMPSRS